MRISAILVFIVAILSLCIVTLEVQTPVRGAPRGFAQPVKHMFTVPKLNWVIMITGEFKDSQPTKKADSKFQESFKYFLLEMNKHGIKPHIYISTDHLNIESFQNDFDAYSTLINAYVANESCLKDSKSPPCLMQPIEGWNTPLHRLRDTERLDWWSSISNTSLQDIRVEHYNRFSLQEHHPQWIRLREACDMARLSGHSYDYAMRLRPDYILSSAAFKLIISSLRNGKKLIHHHDWLQVGTWSAFQAICNCDEAAGRVGFECYDEYSPYDSNGVFSYEKCKSLDANRFHTSSEALVVASVMRYCKAILSHPDDIIESIPTLGSLRGRSYW